MVRRPSLQTVSVLRALTADVTVWRHGYEIGQEIGLKAGSLYPILMRLSDRGLLDSAWERATTSGRPPRHLYRLTADGIAYAREHAVAAAAVADDRRAVRAPARGAAAHRLTPGRAR